ncbi:hypothetical protein [Mycobacterium tuberculosis]|uniref:hypothetical protein n=1 Tax=Mycobacterium tuberculosis TaxID=1773 RepID=UPI00070FED34|nr:hypothetical protein [Mycobacterium tuberculosis]
MWRHLWLMQPQRRYPRGSGTTRTARRGAGVAPLYGVSRVTVLASTTATTAPPVKSFPDLL